jgi:hypothetical protein
MVILKEFEFASCLERFLINRRKLPVVLKLVLFMSVALGSKY